MGKILSIVTGDGYVFFNSPIGYVDAIDDNGVPYSADLLFDKTVVDEWKEDGAMTVHQWSPTWSPVFAGPFKSKKAARDYRDENVERHQPTRIRSMVNRYDGATLWFIDRRREVK